jgi:hypothetical protein
VPIPRKPAIGKLAEASPKDDCRYCPFLPASNGPQFMGERPSIEATDGHLPKTFPEVLGRPVPEGFGLLAATSSWVADVLHTNGIALDDSNR